MEYLRFICFFISYFIFSISFYLSLILILNSKKKHFQAQLASFSFILCSIFFMGHSLLVQNQFQSIVQKLNSIFYPSFILLTFLPCCWSLIVLYFFSPVNVFIKLTNRTIYLCLILSVLISLHYLLFKHYTILNNSDIFKFIFQVPLIVRNLFILLILLTTILPILYIFQSNINKDSIEEIAKSNSFWNIIFSTLLLGLLSIFVSSLLMFDEKNILNEVFSKDKPRILLYDLISCSIILIIIFIVSISILKYQLFTGMYLIENYNLEIFRFAYLFSMILSILNTIILIFGYKLTLKDPVLTISFLSLSFYSHSKLKKLELKQKELFKPFLLRDNLHEIIFSETKESFLDFKYTFTQLCKEYLNTNSACIIPLGSYSYFLNQPVLYNKNHFFITEEQIEALSSKKEEIVFLKKDQFEDFLVCIKIFSKQELSAYLFLSEKKDNLLYSKNEIEVAQLGVLNILEILAITEISKVLFQLQKKQILENRLLDTQTRRILHDEILPEIQSILINIDTKEFDKKIMMNSLMDVHKKISNFLKFVPEGILDFHKESFPEKLLNLAKKELSVKNFNLTNNLLNTKELNSISINHKEIIFYAIREIFRNIEKYAKLDSKKTDVYFYTNLSENFLEICIEDKGKGISYRTEKQGSGMGLILHSTLLSSIHCNLKIESKQNEYTKVIIQIPISKE